MATTSTAPPAQQQLITPKQAAELIGVGIETIWNYCKDPDSGFPHFRLSPKCIRIDRDELLGWLAARRWLGRIQAGERAEGGV
jgi:predicted DNA-binding transcriptional regulator AlpA